MPFYSGVIAVFAVAWTVVFFTAHLPPHPRPWPVILLACFLQSVLPLWAVWRIQDRPNWRAAWYSVLGTLAATVLWLTVWVRI